MTEDEEPVWLTQDWMSGIPWNRNLHAPVRFAQSYLHGWNHTQAQTAWQNLESVFEQWKRDHGTTPGHHPVYQEQDPQGNHTETPPWLCAGVTVADPVDLILQRLAPEEYPPFVELTSPWSRSEEVTLALICVRHAALPHRGLAVDYPPDTARFVAIKAGFWLMTEETQKAIEQGREGFLKATEILGPGFKRDRAYRERQSIRGRKGSDVRWGGGARETATYIIQSLAQWTDELGDRLNPSELWAPFYGELDSEGLDPREADNTIYYGDGRSMTYDAFRKAIQTTRKSID